MSNETLAELDDRFALVVSDLSEARYREARHTGFADALLAWRPR